MSAIFGETLIFQQQDGDDIELVVYGDEYYGRYENTDGYSVLYDIDRGLYCYARLVDGRFTSSGIPVTKRPPSELKRHAIEDNQVRREKFERRYNQLHPTTDPLNARFERTLGINQGLLPGRQVSQGQVRGLTLLLDFADVQSSISAQDVDAMLNAANYTANGNYTSVNGYFHIVSNGKLDYTNDVVGPIRLSKNRDYYKDNLLVEEALTQAIREYNIDLSRYDSRNEGIVDALNFMYAGRSVYEGNLWPHNSVATLSSNGIRTHYYMLTSLGRANVDLSIGTFCHENAHQLCRFPDLYDYGSRDDDTQNSQGIGVYCLMGSGNHLNKGRTPAPVCAYLRYLAGWHDLEIALNSNDIYEIQHGDYSVIYRYATDKPNEYFLIDNRSRIGLDNHLPSSGLAVYHCDTLGSNEWQNASPNRHYQVSLLQADGHLDLENNRNRGDEGDLYRVTPGVALSHDTIPHTREWDGSDSGLLISDISDAGEMIRFRVGQNNQTRLFYRQITADLLIPDSDTQGVSSSISVPDNGLVRDINVHVDIIHSYRGDLQVELESPNGTRVLLHNRQGRSQDDLRETYSSSAHSGLADLQSQSISGEWKLHVRDLARADVGRLNQWSLEIEYSQDEREVNVQSNPRLLIPDFDTEGVNDQLIVEQNGELKSIQVGVHIRHTYIGDLHVELISPSGIHAVLHNMSGYGNDNIKTVYDISNAPALQSLIGQPIQGSWQLRIKDFQKYDEGILEEWSLSIAY